MEKFYAGGFLWNPKTKSVLIHKRDDNTKFNPNKWAFFGGLNEPGETPKQTFKRELNEELGIEISEQAIKPLCDYLNEKFDTYRYVFFVESDLSKMQMHLGEGAGFDWVPLKKVFEYDLSENPRKDLKVFLDLIIRNQKTLKFRHHLAEEILAGRKNVTWRLFDDKDLKIGDKVEFLKWETQEKFAEAEIIDVYEKKMGDIEEKDLEGHEKFENRDEMLETYKKYYGDRVNWDILVKVIKFNLLWTTSQ